MPTTNTNTKSDEELKDSVYSDHANSANHTHQTPNESNNLTSNHLYSDNMIEAAQKLRRGCKVVVLRTENTQSRYPNLIGMKGVITDIPQHPNTWYKVEVDDRSYTLRPSALEVIESDDSRTTLAEGNIKHEEQKSNPHNHRKRSSTSDDLGNMDKANQYGLCSEGKSEKKLSSKIEAFPSKHNHVMNESNNQATCNLANAFSAVDNGEKVFLTSIDTEQWPNRTVKIVAGRLQGLDGKVIKSGNGWVSLQTRVGEKSTRAADLVLTSEKSSSNAFKTKSEVSANGFLGVIKNEAEAMNMTRNRLKSSKTEEVEIESRMNKRPNTKGKVSPSKNSSNKNAHNLAKEMSEDKKCYHNKKPSVKDEKSNASRSPHSKRKDGASTARAARAALRTQKTEVYAVKKELSPNFTDKKDEPLTEEQILAAKIAATAKFEREREQYREMNRRQWDIQIARGKERPNLTYWREEIISTGKNPESDAEETDVFFELMPLRCNICYYEKPMGEKYCWNDKCVASPIYKELLKCNEKSKDKKKTEEDEKREKEDDPSLNNKKCSNTFRMHTKMDEGVTYALNAPVKWLTGRKSMNTNLEGTSHMSPLEYRWYLWASSQENPSAVDSGYFGRELTAGKKRKEVRSCHQDTLANKNVPKKRALNKSMNQSRDKQATLMAEHVEQPAYSSTQWHSAQYSNRPSHSSAFYNYSNCNSYPNAPRIQMHRVSNGSSSHSQSHQSAAFSPLPVTASSSSVLAAAFSATQTHWRGPQVSASARSGVANPSSLRVPSISSSVKEPHGTKINSPMPPLIHQRGVNYPSSNVAGNNLGIGASGNVAIAPAPTIVSASKKREEKMSVSQSRNRIVQRNVSIMTPVPIAMAPTEAMGSANTNYPAQEDINSIDDRSCNKSHPRVAEEKHNDTTTFKINSDLSRKPKE